MFQFRASKPAERPSPSPDPFYFGLRVAPPANPNRPLEGKELEEPHRGPGIRSTWRTTGEPILYAGEKNSVIFGPIGSGKTRKLLYRNLFGLSLTSLIVPDCKGELCAHTAVFRAKRLGHRVIVKDDWGVMPKNYPRLVEKYPEIFRSVSLNPVAAMGATGRLIDDAKALATSLVPKENTREQYFALAGQAAAKGLLLGLRLHYGEKASLKHLREIICLPPDQLAQACTDMIAAYGEQCPAIANSLGEHTRQNPEDRELGAIRRTIQVDLDFLDSREITAGLSGPAFDAASLKEIPTTIYLITPLDLLPLQGGTLLRIYITSLLQPLLRSVETPRVSVLLMLDEFAQMGHMQIIESQYAAMRGFGVRCCLVFQDISQAKRLYGERWESFISNAGIVASFSVQDVGGREYLSKFSGERIIWHERKSDSLSHTTGNDVSVNRGSSTSDVHINERVMKPHELAAMHADEAIVWAQGRYYCVVCPQPEYLPDVAPHLAEARRAIED